MRVTGTHRPTTTYDQATAEPVHIDADGDTYETATEALRALVPAGHQLLHIAVDR